MDTTQKKGSLFSQMMKKKNVNVSHDKGFPSVAEASKTFIKDAKAATPPTVKSEPANDQKAGEDSKKDEKGDGNLYMKTYYGDLNDKDYDMITNSNQKILEGMEEDEILAHQELNEEDRKLFNHFQLHKQLGKNVKEMVAQNISDYDRFFENVYFDEDNEVSYLEPQAGVSTIPPDYYSFYSLNFILEDPSTPINNAVFVCNKITEILGILIEKSPKLPLFVFKLEKVSISDHYHGLLEYLNKRMKLLEKLVTFWHRSLNYNVILSTFRLHHYLTSLLFQDQLPIIEQISLFNVEFANILREKHKLSEVQRMSVEFSVLEAASVLMQRGEVSQELVEKTFWLVSLHLVFGEDSQLAKLSQSIDTFTSCIQEKKVVLSEDNLDRFCIVVTLMQSHKQKERFVQTVEKLIGFLVDSYKKEKVGRLFFSQVVERLTTKELITNFSKMNKQSLCFIGEGLIAKKTVDDKLINEWIISVVKSCKQDNSPTGLTELALTYQICTLSKVHKAANYLTEAQELLSQQSALISKTNAYIQGPFAKQMTETTRKCMSFFSLKTRITLEFLPTISEFPQLLLVKSMLRYLEAISLSKKDDSELKTNAIAFLSNLMTIYTRELSSTQISKYSLGEAEKKSFSLLVAAHSHANAFIFNTLESFDLVALSAPELCFHALLYLEVINSKNNLYYSLKGYIFKCMDLFAGLELNEPTMRILIKISNFYPEAEEFHEEIFYDEVDFIQIARVLSRTVSLVRERLNIDLFDSLTPLTIFLRYIDIFYLTEENICFDDIVRDQILSIMKELIKKISLKELFGILKEGENIISKLIDRYSFSSYGDEVFTFIVFPFASKHCPESILTETWNSIATNELSFIEMLENYGKIFKAADYQYPYKIQTKLRNKLAALADTLNDREVPKSHFLYQVVALNK